MELHDPEYVRGEDGNIGVCIAWAEQLKHSKNLADLIEVGDIIKIDKNKYEVIYDNSYEKMGILIPNKECLAIRHCSIQYIFSEEREKRI